jgi:hypothetical protein
MTEDHNITDNNDATNNDAAPTSGRPVRLNVSGLKDNTRGEFSTFVADRLIRRGRQEEGGKNE